MHLWNALTMNKAVLRLLQVCIVMSLLISVALPRSIGVVRRVKKHTADQRIAEIQALLALIKQLPKIENVEFGHGFVDPFTNGRRKRDTDAASYNNNNNNNGDYSNDYLDGRSLWESIVDNISEEPSEEELLDDVRHPQQNLRQPQQQQQQTKAEETSEDLS